VANFPTGHESQTDDPVEALNKPSSHLAQVTWPVVPANVPALQKVQAELPLASAKEPSAHEVHSFAPDTMKAESVSLVWAIREAGCGDWEIRTFETGKGTARALFAFRLADCLRERTGRAFSA
jgi:hypothetical protein